MITHPQLDGYPVSLEASIRWGEMDAYGHLNNTIFYRYFEDVRIKYMEELDLATSFQDTKMGIVIASSSCKFRAPLKYPDRILVGAKVTTVDEFRFTMLYRIVSLETNRVAAQGDALCVGYNLAKQETSNLNPELIEKIGLLEGRNIIP